MAELRELLERLSNAIGVSGRERAVRLLIKEEITPLVDRMEVDALGNLIAYKAGDGPEPRLRVLLSAHMDEVGFMITKIESSGLLRFRRVGGLTAGTLIAKRVVIGDDHAPGVIGSTPPHLQSDEQRNRVPDIEDLAIDIGAADEKQAKGKVNVGDYGTFATRFTVLSEDPEWPVVRGKAFDDRAGCAALVGILAERYPVDLAVSFSVQEEAGLRGARVAAYRTEPDVAFALEGTVCHDLPLAPDEDVTAVTQLGDGPAVTLMDRSVVAHPGLVRLMQDVAAAEGIAIQYKAPAIGSTEAGAMHLARGGVPATTVAIPCRYIHTPAAILNLNDLANVVRLLGAALRRIERNDLTRA